VVIQTPSIGQLAVGIDIGATYTKIALVDGVGRMLAHQVIPSNLKAPSPQPFLEQAYAIVEGFRVDHPVSGIGIALCSLVNETHTGSFLSVNAPALDGLDIQAAFAGRFGLPVRVINDVAAYALAEYHFGAGGGVRRLLCLALGTGLCIAVLYDGRFVENWGGVTADAARMILDPTSPYRCQAGVRGSAEALLGTAYIEAEAAALSGIPGRRAHEIIALARRGDDPIASRVLSLVGAHAGHLLALLSPVFFPQRILVTGGTAEAGEALFEPMRRRYQELIGDYLTEIARLETGKDAPVEIVKGALGPEAAALGAALPFLNRS
jgi:glucokinase